MQKHRAALAHSRPLPFCDPERGGVERVWQMASIDTNGIVLEAIVYDHLGSSFPKLDVGDKAPLELPISD